MGYHTTILDMISFIYFDIGGVLIQDYSATNKWAEMKRELGITGDKLVQFEKIWSQYSSRINLDLDADDLGQIINRELSLNLPPNYSLLQEFITRFSQNRYLWPLIDQIRVKVKLGLLTNLYPRMLNQLITAQLLPRVNWAVIIDSSTAGLQKPDPAIFKLAIKKAGVPASQILFIDNTQENISAADKLGLQTFWYNSANYPQSTQNLTQFLKDKS